MTYKEVLIACKIKCLGCYLMSKTCEEDNCVTEWTRRAIEKQIPKKLNIKPNKDVFCPTCANIIGDARVRQSCKTAFAYCRYCGQALDWSDEE